MKSIIISVKEDEASELPEENLPAMNPSISDLIVQLDLNKVLGKYTWCLGTIEQNLKIFNCLKKKRKQKIQT